VFSKGEVIDLHDDIAFMQKSVRMFGGDSRILYNRDLAAITGQGQDLKDFIKNVKWFWKSDNGEWIPYDEEVSAAIECAFRENRTTVPVDDQRYINFKRMKQHRFVNSFF
jgi:hypothetical protein